MFALAVPGAVAPAPTVGNESRIDPKHTSAITQTL